MSHHAGALEGIDRDIADASARRGAALIHSREWSRWHREVQYLERKRLALVREAERAEREAREALEREQIREARTAARKASALAGRINRLLPTGAQIRDAHRLREVPCRRKTMAHAARKRRLTALAKRIDQAEALGAPARRVAWARACVRLALEMKPGRVEMATPLDLPYLRCAECGGISCEHPLEGGGIPLAITGTNIPAGARITIGGEPVVRAEGRSAFPWMAPPPKEK